jgi:hypothetical protein
MESEASEAKHSLHHSIQGKRELEKPAFNGASVVLTSELRRQPG